MNLRRLLVEPSGFNRFFSTQGSYHADHLEARRNRGRPERARRWNGIAEGEENEVHELDYVQCYIQRG